MQGGRQSHYGQDRDDRNRSDVDADADADADADVPHQVMTWLEDLVLHQEDDLRQELAAMQSC